MPELHVVVPVVSTNILELYNSKSVGVLTVVGSNDIRGKAGDRFVGVMDWHNDANRDSKLINAVSKGDVRWCFTTVLHNQHDARLYHEAFRDVRSLFGDVVYSIASDDCLSGLPAGSHVTVIPNKVQDHYKYAEYNVWLSGVVRPKKQWQVFCEFVVRGVIPTGIVLPIAIMMQSKSILRRNLTLEPSKDSYEWKKQTSAQNLMAHWEVIQSQMDRISKAGIRRDMHDVYALDGTRGERTNTGIVLDLF